MIVSCEPHRLGVENAMISSDNAPVSELRFSKWSRQSCIRGTLGFRLDQRSGRILPGAAVLSCDLTPKGRRWQADQPIDPRLAPWVVHAFCPMRRALRRYC